MKCYYENAVQLLNQAPLALVFIQCLFYLLVSVDNV